MAKPSVIPVAHKSIASKSPEPDSPLHSKPQAKSTNHAHSSVGTKSPRTSTGSAKIHSDARMSAQPTRKVTRAAARAIR